MLGQQLVFIGLVHVPLLQMQTCCTRAIKLNYGINDALTCFVKTGLRKNCIS